MCEQQHDLICSLESSLAIYSREPLCFSLIDPTPITLLDVISASLVLLGFVTKFVSSSLSRAMDNISSNLVLPGSTAKTSPVSASTATNNISASIVLQRSTTKNPSFTVGTPFGCTCLPCLTQRKGRNNQFRLDPHRHLAFPKKNCTWDGHLRLQPRNYDCEDMTTSLIRNLEKTPWHNRCSTHLQYRALVRWQSWVESQRQMPSLHLALEDKIDLDFFLDFFDQYFFCGGLSEWTSVTWVDFDQNQRYLVGSQRDDPVLLDPFGLIKVVKWRVFKTRGPFGHTGWDGLKQRVDYDCHCYW